MQRKWLIIGVCFSSMIVSPAAINGFAMSVLLKSLAADLDISRGDISTRLMIVHLLTGISSLLLGFLIDRFNIRRVILPGVLAFAVMTAALGFITVDRLWLLNPALVLSGLFAATLLPMAYAKMASMWFDRRRGLALGIVLSGTGVGTMLVPQVAQHFNAAYDWHAAFFALASCIIILALAPGLLFFRYPKPGEADDDHLVAPVMNAFTSVPGDEVTVAIQNPISWRVSFALFLTVTAINGTLFHMVSMLTDRGLSPQSATNVLSVSGLFVILGRVSAGWCLDRFRGQYVAAIVTSMPMMGLAALMTGTGGFVPIVGAVLCGLGLGAEIDLMAFFFSRYFGLKAIGRLMGIGSAILALATGIGPMIMGRSYDATGSYTTAMFAFEGALAVALVLYATLGPYRYLPHHAKP